ncbi:MAG: acetyl-CoA carboxylase, biotin carboxyl carrier protein [Candidatus Parvibacillus calidus]|nr:MAG: acetyl-CoA carboxylase, biotin carboxyl carrier protein [Candidatus Parvibacillus calidus]WKZ61909.1 MAG: acetyl-CoA carboxylase biotin carboxyl carrier protein [Saprospiraceae bacterium]
MTYKEIQELIRQVAKSDLAEVKVKDNESEVTIRTRYYSEGKTSSVTYSQAPSPVQQPAVMTQNVAPSTPKSEAEAPTETKSTGLKEIRSPMVGTFYRSPGPDKAAYVKPGDTISAGTVVCIVEAMKLFNEIESEVSGTIVKVMVEDATPVEYDQVLFLVE